MNALPRLAMVMLLPGCAAAPTEMVDFPEGQPEASLVWPAPPEPGRLRYAGELLGEQNFRNVEGAQDGAGRRLWRWIAGLGGRGAPVDELVRPQSGMVDIQGRILVTDAGRGAVVVFDPQGARLTIWAEAASGQAFLSPVGIAADGGGGYLVADAEIAAVLRLDADGNPVNEFGRGLLRRPTGLCRSAARREIFVADTGAHDIKVFDERGALLRTLGRRGVAPGEFNGPTHLSCAADRLYVSDALNARVQVLSPGGALLHSIGERGLFVGNLVRPKGVVTDRDGHVYVIESYYDYLLVFDEAGQLLLPIGGTGSGAGQFFLPAGAWSDGGDRLFIADMFNGRVVMLDYLGQPR